MSLLDSICLDGYPLQLPCQDGRMSRPFCFAEPTPSPLSGDAIQGEEAVF